MQDTLINKIINKCAILSRKIREMVNTNTVTIVAKFIQQVVRMNIGVIVRLNPLGVTVKYMIRHGGIPLKLRCKKYIRKRITLFTSVLTISKRVSPSLIFRGMIYPSKVLIYCFAPGTCIALSLTSFLHHSNFQLTRKMDR